MSSFTDNFPDISFIGNTTIDEVQTRMINNYLEKYKEITGKTTSLAQANPYRLIMYGCVMEIYQALQYVDFAGKMGLLKYSKGDYLDNLVALRGIAREAAAHAVTTLKFSIDAAISSAISIPAGTRVTNGNDVYFATDEYAEISAGELSVSVSATCTEAGTCGNDFDVGEFSILVNTLPYVVNVSNTVKTYGGSEIEDDDDLRERAYNAASTYSTAGSKEAYEYYAKAASAEVADAKATSSTAGAVEIYIICNDGEMPSDDLLATVEKYLSSDTIRPLTDTVSVLAPNAETYDVDLTYYISSNDSASATSIQEAVETAVSTYNIWQTEKIGRDINPSYLIQLIMTAGAKRVEVASPSFTAIDDTTVAQTGTVTVTYGGLEDD
ncbi:MAG: baseplate J/gp47 family protein [Lachnospiraceae bacterium]|nr:baseplate J/gp47 family protein [Lachnospiraceae bacterium]